MRVGGMDILSPAVPFAHDPQLRARLSTSDDQVRVRRRGNPIIRHLRETGKRCWSWFVFGLLVVWVCAFPVVFLIHSRLLLESVCKIIDYYARTREILCTSAVERDSIIGYLAANLTASVIYLVCMLMKGAVDELDAQHAQMLSPIYLSFFFFCVVTGFGLLIVFPSVTCFASPKSAALSEALKELIMFDTLCVTMGACWQWVLEPVRLQILKQLFGSERVNRSAVLGMARVDIESPAAASGMDHVCRNIEGMDHVCSICLGDMPGDTSLSLETAVEGDIVRHSSGRSGEVSIESSQVIVSFDGPNLSSEGWSVRPVVKLPCGHCFHLKCATDWISRRPTCPVCRARVVGHVALDQRPPQPTMMLPPDLQPATRLEDFMPAVELARR
jgi:hypothetical protein